jgi:hypothetical protein
MKKKTEKTAKKTTKATAKKPKSEVLKPSKGVRLTNDELDNLVGGRTVADTNPVNWAVDRS